MIAESAWQKNGEGIRRVAHALAFRLSMIHQDLLRPRRRGRMCSGWRLPLLQLLLLLRVSLN